MIAAHAESRGLTLVSNDAAIRNLKIEGLKVVTWWLQFMWPMKRERRIHRLTPCYSTTLKITHILHFEMVGIGFVIDYSRTLDLDNRFLASALHSLSDRMALP